MANINEEHYLSCFQSKQNRPSASTYIKTIFDEDSIEELHEADSWSRGKDYELNMIRFHQRTLRRCRMHWKLSLKQLHLEGTNKRRIF